VQILQHFFLTFPIKFQGSFVKELCRLPNTSFNTKPKSFFHVTPNTVTAFLDSFGIFISICFSTLFQHFGITYNHPSSLHRELVIILENTNTYIHKVTKISQHFKLMKFSNFCFTARFTFRVSLTGANVMDRVCKVTQYRSANCVLLYFFQLYLNTSYYMTATIFVCIKVHVYLHTRLCMHKTYRKTKQTSIKSL